MWIYFDRFTTNNFERIEVWQNGNEEIFHYNQTSPSANFMKITHKMWR